MAVIL